MLTGKFNIKLIGYKDNSTNRNIIENELKGHKNEK